MFKFPKVPKWVWITVVVLAAASVSKDLIAKLIVESQASKAVGSPVKIQSLSIGLFTQQVRVDGLRVYNPPGFPHDVLLDVPQVKVKVDLSAALKRQWHFPLVSIWIEKVVAHKNKEGKLNIDELKIVREKIKAIKERQKSEPLPEFTIDVLKLNVGRVVMEDHSREGPPLVNAYEIALKDKTFHNITNVNKLVTVVMVESLKPTAIRSAGMFAATSLLGAAFLPAFALGVVVADDDAVMEMKASLNKAFDSSLALLKRIGTVKQADKKKDLILATVQGCDIIMTFESAGWSKTKITAKARKYMMARPQIAAGILYQLAEENK